MTNKKYLSIIIFLLFIIVVSFYFKNESDKQYKEKVSEAENLIQKNDKLEKENDQLKQKIQELNTDLAVEKAIDVATNFKQELFNVNYDPDKERFASTEEIEVKVADYVTKDQLRLTPGVVLYVGQLSQQTKSNLSVKDITFEVGHTQTETEVSLNYHIEIQFKRVGQTGEQPTITNYGQLRMIKTDDGWKVNKDLPQMKSINEVKEKLRKHGD
ncbi:hypothetical protein [Virgibacillus sp. L01]|uniref:hypothetical protein n=1 Tax=Virgibacillus sp. L01 TaxID=3457429 RepID=UPI003FD1F5B5